MRRRKAMVPIPDADVIELDWDSDDEAIQSANTSKLKAPFSKSKSTATAKDRDTAPPKKKTKTSKNVKPNVQNDDDDNAYSSSLYRRDPPAEPDPCKKALPKPRPLGRKRASPPPLPPFHAEPLFIPSQTDPEPFAPPRSQESLITLPIATSDFGLPPSSILPNSTPDSVPAPRRQVEVVMPLPPPRMPEPSNFFAPSSSASGIPGLGKPESSRGDQERHPSDSGVDLDADFALDNPKPKKKKRSKVDAEDEADWDGAEQSSTKKKKSTKKEKEKGTKRRPTKSSTPANDAGVKKSARAKAKGKETLKVTSAEFIVDSEDEDGLGIAPNPAPAPQLQGSNADPVSDGDDPLALPPFDGSRTDKPPARSRTQHIISSDDDEPVEQPALPASEKISAKASRTGTQKRKARPKDTDDFADGDDAEYGAMPPPKRKAGKLGSKAKKDASSLADSNDEHGPARKPAKPSTSSKKKQKTVANEDDDHDDVRPDVPRTTHARSDLPGDDEDELTPTSDPDPVQPLAGSKENIRPSTPPRSQSSRSSAVALPSKPRSTSPAAPVTPAPLPRPANTTFSAVRRSSSIASTRSTPMSELIRRASAKAATAGAPFSSPAPNGKSYSPFAKSSRSALSRIAPLHPNRRTPPPAPPPP
ncbi:hypothetical protein PUNSTDRAFT_128670, partial [Punctularia strigosozonata HHB-11173 SS5]